MNRSDLTEIIKNSASQLNFDLCNITSAESFIEDRDIAIDRIRSGKMSGLPWFNESRVIRGTDPATLLPEAKSIISVGMNYYQDREPDSNNHRPMGKVAVYAWGKDYHKVVKKRMKLLVDNISNVLGTSFKSRWYIDDGPMLDRAVARRSGVGWIGKNTNLLSPQLGSWVFLGQIITDLELDIDLPLKKHCGTCSRCIDECPTKAITDPYTIDNSRCISHLTIENRGSIPTELRDSIGEWVFGCDICQDVCPVNVKSQVSKEPLFKVNTKQSLDLINLLTMSEHQFREDFAGTPIMRAKYHGMQRNACIVLGNIGSPDSIPALTHALKSDSPIVRGHSAWALGKIGGHASEMALREQLSVETDPEVINEISTAASRITS